MIELHSFSVVYSFSCYLLIDFLLFVFQLIGMIRWGIDILSFVLGIVVVLLFLPGLLSFGFLKMST